MLCKFLCSINVNLRISTGDNPHHPTQFTARAAAREEDYTNEEDLWGATGTVAAQYSTVAAQPPACAETLITEK